MTGEKGQERADERIINEGLVTFWVPSASLRADEGVECKKRGVYAWIQEQLVMKDAVKTMICIALV
jgi:hypothetical protein